MNLMNMNVDHKKFGLGRVVSVEDERIYVLFKNEETKEFAYPAAFVMGLSAVDPDMQYEMIRECVKKNNELKAKEQRKLKEAEKRVEFKKRELEKEEYEKRKKFIYLCKFKPELLYDCNHGRKSSDEENIYYYTKSFPISKS